MGFVRIANLVLGTVVIVGLAIASFASAQTPAKFDVCHKTGDTWNYLDTPDLSAYDSHIAHGDFDYAGPLDENGNGSNAWCNENVPEPTTGTLTVEKVIVGETDANADDFSFIINGGSSTAFEADGSNDVELDLADGLFTVTEVVAAGFDTTYEGCEDIDLTADGATCTITNTVVVVPPATGSLTIMKDTDNEAGNQVEFGFTLDGQSFEDIDNTIFDSYLLGNNGDYETFPDLLEDVHTVAELDKADWSFGSVVCTNADVEGWDAYIVEEDTSVWVTIADGDNITCVFTNTMDEVDDTTITINKVTGVESEQTFDFYLDDAVTPTAVLAGGETSGALDVSAGPHTVTEVGLPDWSLVDITCLDESQVEVVADFEGEGAIGITLAEGDDITCTFTNRLVEDPGDASITIIKQIASANGNLFDFNGSLGLFTLGDDGEKVFSDLEAGSYTINEVLPEGWEAPTIECNDEFSHDAGETDIDISLSEGEDVVCTYTNRETDGDDDNGGGGDSSRRGGGGGSNDGGEVLGEQIALVPAGAPATGMGGMAGSVSTLGSLFTLLGGFALTAGRRK